MYSSRFCSVIIKVIALQFILTACKTPVRQEIHSQSVHRKPTQLQAKVITHVSADSSSEIYSHLHERKAVRDFYHSRAYRLAWQTLGDSMMAMISNVRYMGLLPQHYHRDELLLARMSRDSLSVMRADVLLTDAFIVLARHLRYGKTATPINADSLSIELIDDILLQGGLKPGLENLEPRCAGYRRLRVALRQVIDTSAMRNLLLDGNFSTPEKIFKDVQSIEVNMERWRKTCTRAEPGLYIEVNIPSFMLRVRSGDSTVFESKVIVGAVKTPTPQIESLVDCIVLYPYWHVPRKIAVEEFLPFIKRDTSFLSRNNMDVLDRKGNILNRDSIRWGKFNTHYFPVTLRQREGTENSLGIVKFEFDNPYAVYVHDTNAKRLFNNSARAYSHGCIRMEKAVALAHYLVTGSTSGESALVKNHIEKKTRYTVMLRRPVPIRVIYFTSSIENGKLELYDDIYQRDKAIVTGLYPQQ